MVFCGTPDFAVPSLYELASRYEVAAVITQPDRPRGRGQRLVATPVKKAAQSLGVPLWQPSDINHSEVIKGLISLEPDVLVVVAYGQILKADILKLAPLGAVNLHASLLPDLRGGAPIHWAILRGYSTTGVTTMLMDEGLDTGDILLQEKISIGPDETVGELHDRLAYLGAKLLDKTLVELEKGTIKPIPQDHSKATYAPNLKKGDRLLKWSAGCKAVHNQVRGLNPWPAAYTSYNGRQLIVLRSRCLPHYDVNEMPGTITELTEQGFVVACQSGAVEVLEVRPQNRSHMSAADFCRGYSVSLGQQLGVNVKRR